MANISSTAITNTGNQIIAPPEPHNKGEFQVEGINHMTDETLTLFTNSDEQVDRGNNMRIWYTEDLLDLTEHDNEGKHCIHVLVKYC